eukprot:XP_001696484.1 predicted protein [Chlamydomonas reinhardtii]
MASMDHGSAQQAANVAHETASPFAEQTCLVAEELDAAVQRFSQFLQFRTVSSPLVPHHTVEPDEFRRLHDWMPTAFPEVWETLEVEEVGDANLSYLLKWVGTLELQQQQQQQQQQHPAAAAEGVAAPLLPVLFLSHLDVVPVANETLSNWTHPPFSGAVAGGYVWGRGALDDKVGVSGLLEAATLLIRTGWRPARTLYFSFGQDEEVGGEKGAARRRVTGHPAAAKAAAAAAAAAAEAAPAEAAAAEAAAAEAAALKAAFLKATAARAAAAKAAVARAARAAAAKAAAAEAAALKTVAAEIAAEVAAEVAAKAASRASAQRITRLARSPGWPSHAQISALLASRGVKVDMVFDEGGSIGSDGYPPYSTKPLALVGLAEKGFATVLVQVSAAGGHSSIPPLDGSSAAAVAARIITAIDRRPPPTRLAAPVTQFLGAIADSTPGLRGQLFSVVGSPLAPDWLRDLVASAFLGRDTPETAALVRNTAAVTGLTSGFAENVLPPSATVRVNFRLLPGATTADVIAYLTDVAGPDLPRVRFEMSGGQNGSMATPVTSASSPYFAILKAAVQQVYQLKDGSGSVDVAPTLMAGGTDSKHYLPISAGGALRHVPVSLNKTAGDMRRVHGLNERVSVADFGRGVCVFQRLIQMVGGSA